MDRTSGSGRDDPGLPADVGQRAFEECLARGLRPEVGDVSLRSLLGHALAEVLTAAAAEEPDGTRRTTTAAAAAAVPPPLSSLMEAVFEAQGDPIDVSDTDELAETIDDVIFEDQDRFVDAFIRGAFGGTRPIGEVGEDASYSPAHSSDTLYLESFTWRGDVWYLARGPEDLVDPDQASFLYTEGDEVARRAALIGLAETWMGAGLECDADPEIHRVARSRSWLTQWDRANWWDSVDGWDVPDPYQSAEELADAYSDSIAGSLGRSVDEVAAVIRALVPAEDDEEDDDQHRGGLDDEDLPKVPVDDELEKEVRRELWWAMRCS